MCWMYTREFCKRRGYRPTWLDQMHSIDRQKQLLRHELIAAWHTRT
jgi:hypothetical protein